MKRSLGEGQNEIKEQALDVLKKIKPPDKRKEKGATGQAYMC